MTKAELIERIARSRNLPPDITKKDIGQVLGIAFEELATYFAKARVTRTSSPRFTFPRFGTFTKKKRSARRGVNPRTLEPMQIDACCTVDFKASRELRESMNGPSSKAGKSTKTAAKTKRTTKKAAPATSKKTTKKTKRAAAKTTRASGHAVEAKSNKAPAKSNVGSKRGSTRSQASLRGRKLTPRDEDAELDALIDDDALFDELPASRLQRVRPSSDDAAETA